MWEYLDCVYVMVNIEDVFRDEGYKKLDRFVNTLTGEYKFYDPRLVEMAGKDYVKNRLNGL